jgi:hypothetical protein
MRKKFELVVASLNRCFSTAFTATYGAHANTDSPRDDALDWWLKTLEDIQTVTVQA